MPNYLLYGKSSRGYCGFFKGYYYRSFIEFLYLQYLFKHNIPFEIENKKIQTPFGTYKNDFELSTGEIIEIKDDDFRIADNQKIKYVVETYGVKIIYRHDIEKNFSKIELLELKNQVKQNLVWTMKNQQNPRYGCDVTKETRKKIGETTRKRLQDPCFCEKHRQGVLNFWKTPKGLEVRKLISKSRIAYSKIKREQREKESKKICPICKKRLGLSWRITCNSPECVSQLRSLNVRKANCETSAQRDLRIKETCKKNLYMLEKYQTYLNSKNQLKRSLLLNHLSVKEDIYLVRRSFQVSDNMSLLNALFKLKEEEC